MAFLTLDAARNAAQLSGVRSVTFAESLRKSSAPPLSTPYDIFLSHSRLDADLVLGIKIILEQSEGLKVYVDWIEDPQLDRSRVDAATANRLRERMRHCQALMFATSTSSSDSKWMPWELGFFDGFRSGNVSILPLVASVGASFIGQEYLGLYPLVQIMVGSVGRRLGISRNGGRMQSVSEFAL